VSETAESINAVNRERLGTFHHDYYRPNNAFLLVVGAVDPQQVFAAATKAFGSWAKVQTAPAPQKPQPTIEGRRIVFVQRPNSVQSSIAVGNLTVRRSDPRWYEMQVANTIFGGAFNSRIVRNIREDKGYTYSPSSLFQAFTQAGFYKFAADVRNEVTGPTLTEVFKEIDKFKAEGSSGDELNGAKQYMRGLFAFQSASQAGLSAVLNGVYLYGLPKDYPETFRARVSAVTPEQVKAGANLLFGGGSVVVVVGDWTKVKDQLSGYQDITFLDITGKPIAAPGE
jgi:predicted Zn-dependent peptidase